MFHKFFSKNETNITNDQNNLAAVLKNAKCIFRLIWLLQFNVSLELESKMKNTYLLIFYGNSLKKFMSYVILEFMNVLEFGIDDHIHNAYKKFWQLSDFVKAFKHNSLKSFRFLKASLSFSKSSFKILGLCSAFN